MKTLRIAAHPSTLDCFETSREIIALHQTDFTDVAAAVLSVEDVQRGMIAHLTEIGLNIPLFVAVSYGEELNTDVLPALQGVFELGSSNIHFYGKQLEAAAVK